MKNTEEIITNLIIPGAGKSGTSSLHAYLNQHPQISMARIKEPAFFAIDERFNKGFSWYNSFFDNKPGAKFYGESSTAYFGADIAIERIKKYVNNPKFIILLRNPIDRIYSHYTWFCSMGLESLPFRQAIETDMHSIYDPNKSVDNRGYKHYLFSSKYGSLVEKYQNAFSKENIFIITTENLKASNINTLNECFVFLRLQKMHTLIKEMENVTPKMKRVDTSPDFVKRIAHAMPAGIKQLGGLRNKMISVFSKEQEYPVMTNDEKAWLYSLLKEEILKLKKITGNNFNEWTEFAQL